MAVCARDHILRLHIGHLYIYRNGQNSVEQCLDKNKNNLINFFFVLQNLECIFIKKKLLKNNY